MFIFTNEHPYYFTGGKERERTALTSNFQTDRLALSMPSIPFYLQITMHETPLLLTKSKL